MAKGRIENTLKFLVNEELVYKETSKYYITANLYKYNELQYREITQMRIREQKQMLELLETTQCYNRFVVNALDDKTACNCGLCGNCLGYEEYPSAVTEASLIKAEEYLDKLIYCPLLQTTSLFAMPPKAAAKPFCESSMNGGSWWQSHHRQFIAGIAKS